MRVPNLGTSSCSSSPRSCSTRLERRRCPVCPHLSHPHGIRRQISTTVGAYRGAYYFDRSSVLDGTFSSPPSASAPPRSSAYGSVALFEHTPSPSPRLCLHLRAWRLSALPALARCRAMCLVAVLQLLHLASPLRPQAKLHRRAPAAGLPPAAGRATPSCVFGRPADRLRHCKDL